MITSRPARAYRRDNNLRAAFVHVATDVVVSVLVTSDCSRRALNWLWLDPRSASGRGPVGSRLQSVRSAGAVLLDMSPDPPAVEDADRLAERRPRPRDRRLPARSRPCGVRSRGGGAPGGRVPIVRGTPRRSALAVAHHHRSGSMEALKGFRQSDVLRARTLMMPAPWPRPPRTEEPCRTLARSRPAGPARPSRRAHSRPRR